MGIDPALAISKMQKESFPGIGGDMDPRQTILNLLSLCIFPFAARPVVIEILYQGDNEAFIAAMKERKDYLPRMFQMIMNQNR
jgi:hypothetical protein